MRYELFISQNTDASQTASISQRKTSCPLVMTHHSQHACQIARPIIIPSCNIGNNLHRPFFIHPLIIAAQRRRQSHFLRGNKWVLIQCGGVTVVSCSYSKPHGPSVLPVGSCHASRHQATVMKRRGTEGKKKGN